MAGRLALRAEVFLGLDQSRAEDLGPEPIDGDARRQRVLGVDEPSRQPEPVLGRAGRASRWSATGTPGSTALAGVEEVPLAQHASDPTMLGPDSSTITGSFGIGRLGLLERGDLVAQSTSELRRRRRCSTVGRRTVLLERCDSGRRSRR